MALFQAIHLSKDIYLAESFSTSYSLFFFIEKAYRPSSATYILCHFIPEQKSEILSIMVVGEWDELLQLSIPLLYGVKYMYRHHSNFGVSERNWVKGTEVKMITSGPAL